MSPQPLPFSLPQLSALLAGLQDDFVLLETARITEDNQRSLLFQHPVDRLRCTNRLNPLKFLERCQHFLDRGFHLAGWFSYEFGLGLEPRLRHLLPADTSVLADLGVYNAPAVYDHCQASWDRPDVPSGHRPPASWHLDNIRLNQSREIYGQHIAAIKNYIAAGDTYQVNYTLKLLFDFQGSADDFYLQLRRNQMVSYGAYLRHRNQRIMSFSPELFFRKEHQMCTVRPMKGTSVRGRNLGEDRELARQLQNDEKNRAENVMIVDLLRNDLGRLAAKGSVAVRSLFDIETYESLLQMTSTITGTLPGPVSLSRLFKALFPCGSVTGAPKIRTMEIIHELETTRRGVYTGAIGYLTPDGDGIFNVPIRTVILDGTQGEMGIGSGIVADSSADKEWQECRLKAHFLSKPRQNFQLIETMLWTPELGYWLLDRHLDRVEASARYFSYPFARNEVSAVLTAYQATLSSPASRVRLLCDSQGRPTLSHSPCPLPVNMALPDRSTETEPGRTCLAREQTDATDIFLYHKTTQRQFYDQHWRQASEAGYLDVIFTNMKGEISEGAITNIFVEKEGIFFTPPVQTGLLAGVLRGYLLDTYPQQVREKTLSVTDLADPAATLYLGNSVRGLVRVELPPPAENDQAPQRSSSSSAHTCGTTAHNSEAR